MPTFRINLVNRDFRANNDRDLPNQEAALKEGMKAALEIGSEEICDGQPFFAAEITIARNGEVLERRMVVVGASPLQFGEGASAPMAQSSAGA